ncbi:nucleoid-associated protein [Planococcus sp. A6]|uniref:nucleoid-associated protein n=1 Tax=Planococcus sp. A6 TaxID=2992760 RepID=UPI00237B2A17|nr:nucleoid-associated protein [Planococcus sp. A6]MDE0584743.1 nucleoid-associated protein [Planococcus sp. A6]
MVNQTEVKETVEIGNIVINNLAITILNLEKSHPQLAKKTLKLKTNEHKVILEFFYKHINETRKGRRTRECEFLTPAATVLKKVQNYQDSKQNSKDGFLEFSNEISKYLFRIMKDKKSKSSGSFFILDIIMNNEPMIVMLKLDPKNGVQIDLETLNLLEVANMLPETNDRVHKCAIIKMNYIEGETNLFVMDRQQKSGETSQYFLTTFLQSSAIPNNNKKTIVVLEEAYERISPKLPNIENELVNATIDKEFHNGLSIHLPQSIENIFEHLIPSDTVDREILIDDYTTEFIENFTTKYEDYGLHFVVERDEKKITYGSKSKQVIFKYDKALDGNEIIIKDNPKENIYTITIKNDDDLDFKKIIK